LSTLARYSASGLLFEKELGVFGWWVFIFF